MYKDTKNKTEKSLLKETISVLFILSILFNCTTSQLINKDSNRLTTYNAKHQISPFYNQIDNYQTNSNYQFIGNKYFIHYPISNSIKNVPPQSLSILNDDHNFESKNQQSSTNDLSVLLKQFNLIRKRKHRSISNSSKVFNRSINHHQLNQTMPINANHSNAALNQFSRSLNLLDSSLKNTTQFNMTFSPSTLPFISSDNVKTSSGPDQIYIDILSSTRFWVQRIGECIQEIFVNYSFLKFDFFLNIASPLVIIIGVIGNSMTIVIMTRKRMRSSTNVYLAALATVDMLYLTFTFILSIKHYPGINRPTPVTRLYWRLLPILMMAADACTNCSGI